MQTQLRPWIVLLLVCLMAPGVPGQTLHFIVFADTDDPAIGNANQKTATYLEKELAVAIAAQAGYTLNFTGFTGKDCRVTTLETRLSALKPTSADVVLFYFAGHGWNSRQNEYPSLILGNANTDRAALDASSRNLHDLYGQLRAKNARLTIVIGEACNKERSDAPPEPPRSSRLPMIMKTTAYSKESFKRLFGGYQGGLVLASSGRGQLSLCDPKGGLMSIALQNALRQLLSDSQKGPVSWETALKAVVAQTKTAAGQMGLEQTPFYEIDIRPVAPSPIDLPPPTAPSTGVTCAPPETYVNETALAGIREDLPLLNAMNEEVNSNNADQYARDFLKFYANQKAFYDNLGQMVFYESSTMPAKCRPEFQRNISWIRESTAEINERYQLIQKFALKPMQLAAQARSELPSLIRRLEEILEQLDK